MIRFLFQYFFCCDPYYIAFKACYTEITLSVMNNIMYRWGISPYIYCDAFLSFIQNQTTKESPEKAIKLLDNSKEEMFNKDFMFYLLVAYRLQM